MRHHKILIVDERLIRLRRLSPLLAAEPRVMLLPPAHDLTDAYNLTEMHRPDAILLGAELAAQPEFLMYRALVDSLSLRCIAYGGPAAGSRLAGTGLEFVLLEDDGNVQPLFNALGMQARPAPTEPNLAGAVRPGNRYVVIGASTGGVEALLGILEQFPVNCPPTLIVQHIRPEFTAGLVSRLDRHCAAHVSAARDGEVLAPGQVLVAPDDRHHLVVRAGGAPRCRLVPGDAVSGHRPSVDMLFRSAAALGVGAVGVLLTGMGRDGAEGLLEIRRNGGHTIVQDRQSCTVYGMPRAAVELGAAVQELPLPRIGQAILSACREFSATAG